MVGYLLEDAPPDDAREMWSAQRQGVLWVCGRKWLDFVLWAPERELPARVWRILPDAELHAAFETIIPEFCDRLDAAEQKLMAMGARKNQSTLSAFEVMDGMRAPGSGGEK